MTDFGYLIFLGIAAFVSTNIDDIFLLILFFSNNLKFPPYEVVIGQYIGIGLLVAISIIISFISLEPIPKIDRNIAPWFLIISGNV